MKKTKVIKNFFTERISAIMDCVARDSEGKLFDVEIQQDNEGASPKRARYHSGLMDMNTLNPGQDFDELPESYVIFITRDDTLEYSLPIYHIDRQIKEIHAVFRDELKNTQKGVELMCHEMEKIYSEGMENGEKRGIEKIAAFWLKLPVVWVFFIVNLDELLKVPAVYVPFATAS